MRATVVFVVVIVVVIIVVVVYVSTVSFGFCLYLVCSVCI